VTKSANVCREQFEKWVSDDPYSRPIDRIPYDPEKFAFPGVYRDINTDLAWQAWRVAWEMARMQKPGWVRDPVGDLIGQQDAEQG